jgi:heme-degrading monooxygenase HmoA
MSERTGNYVVIFISQLGRNSEGYAQMASEMVERVSGQPGFLGFDSARGEDGMGITVSYWESLAAIKAWKNDVRHRQAQQLGREQWYESFTLHVARIERSRSSP